MELLHIYTVSTIRAAYGILLWRWEQSGKYTTKSTYNFFTDPEIKPLIYKTLWIAKILREDTNLFVTTHQR
jgi:hypothetical protein